MNYLEAIAQMIWDKVYGTGPEGKSSYEFADKKAKLLFRHYAVLCRTTGSDTTEEHVHDAWVAWQSGIKPDHRSCVPFDQLLPGIQALDTPYVDAIRLVAIEVQELEYAHG